MAVVKPLPPDDRRNFIGKWRDKKGVKQDELAAALGMSRENLSKIENGRRQYMQRHLELASKFLDVPIVALIAVDPDDYNDLMARWVCIPSNKRADALRVLDAFTGADSKGTIPKVKSS
jgi:transcriptional regulator with XRE-family HTH domain